jgi:hypothetical protein
MKGMASAPDFYQAPPPGQYPATLTLSEATISKSGNTQIHIQGTIDGPPSARGSLFDDYLITDGGARGVSQAKQRFRQLGIKEIDSDADVDDNVIAQKLFGLRVMVQVTNEPQMTKGPSGAYDQPKTEVDPRSGQTITIQKLRVASYSLQGGVGGHIGAAPQQVQSAPQQLPQQFQAAPPTQQFVQPVPVQQFVQQPVQQFVQPPAQQVMQYAPPQSGPPAGWPGVTAVAQQAPQQAPQQFVQVQPVQAQAPQQTWPPGIPQYGNQPPVTGQTPMSNQPIAPPWANSQAAQATEQVAPKKRAKITPTDA